MGGGTRKEEGREEGWDGGIGIQGGAGDSCSVGRRREISRRGVRKEQDKERKGVEMEMTVKRKKGRKQKKKKKQNNNNVTKKDFWHDKEPQK